MPFLKGRDRTNMTETHNSPLSSLSFDPDNLSPEGEEVITQYVQMALVERFGERVIPLDQVALEYDGLAKDEANDTLKTLGERSGESLGADFMVVGTVWRYRERVGSSAGASSPASVAFALHIVDVSSGKRVWTARFDETQRPLSEYLLDAPTFFKRGAKWVTASELARYGVHQIFKKFPLQ